MALVNYHFSDGFPRPSVPALIEVGGLQVKETPDPLPIDINDWIENAKHGVIYFSFGANVKTSYLHTRKLEEIKKTFSKLKQRVIWKYENDSMDGLPNNVRIWKWLPQDDLLAHPNVKLFITHGGLGSILEAKVRGVPIVGIPLYSDQRKNVEVCRTKGWAVVLSYNDLNEKTLTNAITEALYNPKYRENVRRLSRLHLDRPMSAMNTATFWAEYVIRHRGAKHMQSKGVYLNWFQLHSFDVIGLILLILITTISILFGCITYICLKIWRRPKNETIDTERNKID